MRAEIICIGTELLLGDIVNTNAAFLSQKLAEIGIDVYYQVTLGDNPPRLLEMLKQAASRSEIVLTSGGLGPTVDDITTETLAALLDRRVILHEEVLKHVKASFAARNVPFPSESIRQAHVPEGVKWVKNNVGSAPGLIAEYNNAKIICLPGPPREIEAMFTHDIIPVLKKMAGGGVLRTRTLKITGMPESKVDGMVKDLLVLPPPTTVGIYAKLGQVELKIMSKAANAKTANRAIAKIEREIRSRLKDHIFGCDTETLESVIGDMLRKKKMTIAVAESCSGGLLANRLTNVSGSSDYFWMGLIAYSDKIKERMLGVSPKTIKSVGAVSKEVAMQMAWGIKFLARTSIGVGITGIAGPTGGTAKKPLGLVYIALVTDKGRLFKECRFLGTREEIKQQASQMALNLIRKNI